MNCFKISEGNVYQIRNKYFFQNKTPSLHKLEYDIKLKVFFICFKLHSNVLFGFEEEHFCY